MLFNYAFKTQKGALPPYNNKKSRTLNKFSVRQHDKKIFGDLAAIA